MHNEIFHIGSFTIYGYGLMIAIGILAAIFTADKRSAKRGLDRDALWSLFIWVIVMGAVGCKVLYIIVELKSIIADPTQLLDIANGFVIYGGIIFGIATIYVFCKVKKFDFLTYLDLIIPSVALAQGFGRIGCFLAGCCYGKECATPLSIVFTDSLFAPNGVPLLPTQLIMSAGDFIIAFALMAFAKKNRTNGKVGAYYMLSYGTGRFLIEFLRGDPRGNVGFLSTSQFVSLFIIALGIVFTFSLKRKEERDEDERANASKDAADLLPLDMKTADGREEEKEQTNPAEAADREERLEAERDNENNN